MSIKFLGKIKGENISKLTIRRWTDSMANLLGIEIEKEFGIKFSEKQMASVIRYIANKVAINLPALYIKSLEYDGEKHIEKLLPKYLGAKVNPLNNWIMEHMLVGMVKRIFEPGCKFDEIMVLTGEQGLGKTTFIEKLALMPDWYCSLNSIKGKDAISNLVGKIVVELEEFVALRNSKSADEAKLFISARTSTVRLPYRRGAMRLSFSFSENYNVGFHTYQCLWRFERYVKCQYKQEVFTRRKRLCCIYYL